MIEREAGTTISHMKRDIPASQRNSSNYANRILFAFHPIFVC